MLGGALHQPPVLSGVLGPERDREIIGISGCRRIAHRHDAAVIAWNADPVALLIKSPLQSRHSAICGALLSLVVVPLCALLRETKIHDTTIAPRPFPADARRLRARQPSDGRLKQTGAHLVDEVLRRGVRVARNREQENNTSHAGVRNIFSDRKSTR